MQTYQQRYIDNVREIMHLGDFYSVPRTDFNFWYTSEKANRQRMTEL